MKSKQIFKMLVFTTFLLDVQHLRDSVKKNPESLLVVSFIGKASYSQAIYPSWWPSQKDLQIEQHYVLEYGKTDSHNG